MGPGAEQPAGTVLVNLLDASETVVVGSGVPGQQITFTLPGYGTKILVPQAQRRPPRVRTEE